MVDLAQGIKQFRTSRKMSVNVDNASMPNESSALLRHDSQMSKLSRLSLKPSEAEQCEPLYVVFIEDGTKISSQKTRSFKLDINKYIQKYKLKISKFLNKTPTALIEAQRKFNERAFAELLEDCTNKVNKRIKEVDQQKTFETLFTIEGRKLESIEDI